MMSRHFRLSSELTGAIAKRLPHAKNQFFVPGSFFNQFVTDRYRYICKKKFAKSTIMHNCSSNAVFLKLI